MAVGGAEGVSPGGEGIVGVGSAGAGASEVPRHCAGGFSNGTMRTGPVSPETCNWLMGETAQRMLATK